ncbi:MAG: hypothetical protein ACXVGA_06775 [Mycobacteriaceae bacterium]
MTIAIPTSGVARRRAKAIARRRHVRAQENDRLVAAGHLPLHWTSLDTCPCGRVSWLEEGATDEDRDAFYEDSAVHDSYCDGAA